MLYAVLASVLGTSLAILAQYLLSLLPKPDPDATTPLYRLLPGMIGISTVITVLALLFFGVRAYLTGEKVRHSIQKSRKKFSR